MEQAHIGEEMIPILIFVWVKTYAKSGKWFWGMGNMTRSNAEICLIDK